jgi:hypothetical protein
MKENATGGVCEQERKEKTAYEGYIINPTTVGEK